MVHFNISRDSTVLTSARHEFRVLRLQDSERHGDYVGAASIAPATPTVPER